MPKITLIKADCCYSNYTEQHKQTSLRPPLFSPTFCVVNMSENDNAWVFDSLICFLNGPIWNAPLQSFIEEKSLSKLELSIVFSYTVTFLGSI